MNDRFKFRVWDDKRDEYIAPRDVIMTADGKLMRVVHDFIETGDDAYGTSYLEALNEKYIIEQCTGLRDRNGKLIYEGDVLENTPVGWTFRVVWNGAAWFAESDDLPLLERLNIMPLGICKVVGNIHEVTE